MSDQINFEKENSKLLEYILTQKFFFPFKKHEANDDIGVELYITTECNQKCEYCYLVKNGDELYPLELRNKDTIINNLKILLNFFIENNMYLPRLDIFSGEVLGTKFGYRILETILDAIKNGLKMKTLIIPTNASFLLNLNDVEKMQHYIDEYKEQGVFLALSMSVDGLIVEEHSRSFKDESKNSLRNQEFYDRLLDFSIRNKYGFHPMLSAHSIKDWKENLVWWESQLSKYNLKPEDIMMLEVRNDEWTLENILDFLSFINFKIDRYIEKHSLKNFVEGIVLGKGERSVYRPERLAEWDLSIPTCTIAKSLAVRMGDLAIVPCHRLSYDKFLYGKFRVENNKIVGIDGKNVMIANKIYYGSCKTTLQCQNCDFVDYCMRGCLGSQYEINGDPFLICDSVCTLEKAKNCFLAYKYEVAGIIDELHKMGRDGDIAIVNRVKRTKEYGIWKNVAQSIVSSKN